VPARLNRIAATYPELLLVLVAAGIGLTAGRPLRWVDDHQGINALLVVLVFATAVTVSTNAIGRLRSAWPQLAAALAVGAVVLPVVSWLASQLVAAGSLRHGIMAIGLAPCEIASVATTGLAGGDAAVAATVLIGSTVVTVVTAGPILSLEAGSAHVRSAHQERAAGWLAALALAGLVALVAAQVRLGSRYLAVLGAIAIILGVSAVFGATIGRTTTRELATPLLLTISMRDFAIAAALATAAFGPAAAAPLGLYGVVVIIWGTAVAGRLRARPLPG
jgi:predicted Na+-dependent transporter